MPSKSILEIIRHIWNLRRKYAIRFKSNKVKIDIGGVTVEASECSNVEYEQFNHMRVLQQ